MLVRMKGKSNVRNLTPEPPERAEEMRDYGLSRANYGGRRIHETDGRTPAKDLYYSVGWQMIEERESAAVKRQYVWSPAYVDAMVLRDRDADANSGNGLEERLYAQHDANFNVTALVNTSGAVVERYVYDPYGAATVLDANWAADAPLSPFPYLRVGVRVEVRAGPFRGLKGVIEDVDHRDRIIFQVQTLGQAVSMEIDGSLLDVIDE